MVAVKRKLITIDEEKCNGCGDCITGCAEGALQLVNGKAKLVKEQFCDGFGDCIKACPTGALKIVDAVAEDFDRDATLEHVAKTGGEEAARRFLEAEKEHAEKHAAAPRQEPRRGCPGSMMQVFGQAPKTASAPTATGPAQLIPSELTHWPIQIHLVQPNAPFFKDRELVVMSTCAPIASPDVHWRFIKGRSVVVGCPKLDRTDGYAEKLAAILSEPSIPVVKVIRMEVPCCGGLTAIVGEAVSMSGRSDLVFEEVTIGLRGEVSASVIK